MKPVAHQQIVAPAVDQRSILASQMKRPLLVPGVLTDSLHGGVTPDDSLVILPPGKVRGDGNDGHSVIYCSLVTDGRIPLFSGLVLSQREETAVSFDICHASEAYPAGRANLIVFCHHFLVSSPGRLVDVFIVQLLGGELAENVETYAHCSLAHEQQPGLAVKIYITSAEDLQRCQHL